MKTIAHHFTFSRITYTWCVSDVCDLFSAPPIPEDKWSIRRRVSVFIYSWWKKQKNRRKPMKQSSRKGDEKKRINRWLNKGYAKTVFTLMRQLTYIWCERERKAVKKMMTVRDDQAGGMAVKRKVFRVSSTLIWNRMKKRWKNWCIRCHVSR